MPATITIPTQVPTIEVSGEAPTLTLSGGYNDASLTTRISTEESTRSSADTSLTARISAEESARAALQASDIADDSELVAGTVADALTLLDTDRTTLSASAFQPLVVTGSQPAQLNRLHIIVATGTLTDPSPSEGAVYEVFVRNGTATVGGTAYSTAGTYLVRTFHSGAWATYQINSTSGGSSVSLITGTTTAAVSTTYHARGTFTVSDPATPSTDDWYEVRVFGTGSVVTVGGTGAIVLGPNDRVIRRWNGSAWVNNPVFAPIAPAVVRVTETVTNSAVLTPSTQLTHTLLPGTYWVEAHATVNATSTTAAGANLGMQFTGTGAPVGTSNNFGSGVVSTSANGATLASAIAGAPLWDSQFGVANQSRTMLRQFIFSVTVSGSMAVTFAQHTAASGQSAQLVRGFLRITRTA